MKEPNISVIMPLYNAQKFLTESIESVLAQKYEEFELICINDCSEDQTLEILKEYQKKDSRIIILENEKRSGAAYSRNCGLESARGKYIILLDGDDIFDEETLKVAYEAAEKNCTDVLIFEYKHVSSENIREKAYIQHGDKYIQKYCNQTFSIKECMPYEILLWSASPCNKLFRSGFINDKHIRFQSLACCNDVYFVEMSLMLSERTMVLKDSRVMLYVREHMEPSRISSFRDPNCCFKAYEFLMEELIKRDEMTNLYQHFCYRSFFSFVYELKMAKDRNIAKQFYEFLKKEGIDRLWNKGYSNDNRYINYLLSKFKNTNLGMEWFQEESLLNVSLVDHKDIFLNIFRMREHGFKIVLWGVGKYGKTILESCSKYSVRMDYVVDEDSQKQGTWIGEYQIMKPEIVLEELIYVVASPAGYYDKIKNKVQEYNKNSQVIDICQYLGIR